MNISLVQFAPVWEDAPANCAQVEALLAAAPPAPRALVVLPEMFATGFSMNVPRVAEPIDGPTVRFLKRLAVQHNAWLLAGVAVLQPDKSACNEALAVSPTGEIISRYRKLFLFSYTNEPAHYRPGNQIAPFDCDGVRVSPVVCYDLRFPEAFRAASLDATEVFGVLANWPDARIDHWNTLIKARAIENQAAVVGVNRIGQDPTSAYSGQSQVIDAEGRTILQAGEQRGVITTNIDLSAQRAYRERFGALKDVRPALFR